MLRRNSRLFLRALAAALALAAVALAVSAAAAFAVYRGSTELFRPVSVALVDREDSLFSRIAINVVRGQEFISQLMEIEDETEEGALEGLESGAYAAAVILPEGYLDAMMTGKGMKGTIILSQAAALSGEVVDSVGRLGQLLLASGQYGVFAGEELIQEHGLGSEAHDAFLAESNSRLLEESLGAYERYFDVEILPYGDTGMSAGAYSAALWACFLLSISGVLFAKMHTADSGGGINARLRSCGVKWHEYIAGKVLFPFLFSAVIAAIGAAIGGVRGAGQLLALLAACAFAAVFTAGIFGAAPRFAAAFIAVIGAVGLVLCGGVIPRGMLPGFVPAIGDCTPLGCALWLAAPAFGGRIRALPAILALVYCLAALYLARRAYYSPKTRGDGQ